MANEINNGTDNANLKSQDLQSSQQLLDTSTRAARNNAWSIVCVIIALLIGIAIGCFML